MRTRFFVDTSYVAYQGNAAFLNSGIAYWGRQWNYNSYENKRDRKTHGMLNVFERRWTRAGGYYFKQRLLRDGKIVRAAFYHITRQQSLFCFWDWRLRKAILDNDKSALRWHL